jgi:putative ATPase
MVEGSDWGLESGEVLTTSPPNKARDAWLQRTIANSGRNLAELRERLFEAAGLQRHHLVLDLNAGSGLLTWEAVRRTPEGRVYALTADATAAAALRQQAERLPELERPVILQGDPTELNYLLTLRDEYDLRFDCILARNPFTYHVSRITYQEVAAELLKWLLPGGRFCFSQTIPRHSQRLYKLIEWANFPARTASKVAKAEEAIYTNPADSLVNWDETDLAAALSAAGWELSHFLIEKQSEIRRITAEQLTRWFQSNSDERPSYAQHLKQAGLKAADIEKIATLYERQLLNQTVSWQTTIVVGVALPVP